MKETPPGVAVIIVNYNAGPFLEACLQSVEVCLQDENWEGVVVDNASGDGSDEAAASRFSRLSLLRNRTNVGFARAVNQGVRASKAPLLLIVNPDCEIQKEAVPLLRAALEEDTRCALAGPEILNPDGTRQGNARGDPDMMTGLFGRSTLLTRVLPTSPIVRKNIRGPEELPPGATSLTVDWLSGACFLARRTAFEQVGGFDERYFLYWEDADLGKRLRQKGFTIRYVPRAIVIHALGQCSRTSNALAVREFHRSAFRYYRTHVARSPLHPLRPVAAILLGLRCAYYLLRAWRATGRWPLTTSDRSAAMESATPVAPDTEHGRVS